jgi:hypothetical protein
LGHQLPKGIRYIVLLVRTILTENSQSESNYFLIEAENGGQRTLCLIDLQKKKNLFLSPLTKTTMLMRDAHIAAEHSVLICQEKMDQMREALPLGA